MIVDVKTIGSETIQLVDEVDRPLVLRNLATGVVSEVSALEANAFMSSNPSRLENYFFSRGGLGDGYVPTSRLTAVAAGLSHGIPIDNYLVTLVDTTVVRNSVRLVAGTALPSPAELLDLATLLFTLVFYDFVAVDLEDESIPSELVGVLLPIRLRERDEIDPKYNFAANIANTVNTEPQYLELLDESWTEFLGVPIHIDYGHVNQSTSSPGVWDYLPGETFGDGWDPIRTPSQRRSDSKRGRDWRKGLTRDVSIQTWRYFVNDLAAEKLGISYNCTSLRYPIERVALRTKQRYRWLADSMLDELLGKPSRSNRVPPDAAFLPRVRLPHPLSVVLGRAKSRTDVWSELLALRDKMTPVRERLNKDRDEGLADGKILNGLTRDLSGRAFGASTFDAVLAQSSAIAGALPFDGGSAALALKIASTVRPAERAHDLVRYLIKPELRVLRAFRQDVQRLQGSIEDLERLWEFKLDREWIRAALKLSDSGTLDAASLRLE